MVLASSPIVVLMVITINVIIIIWPFFFLTMLDLLIKIFSPFSYQYSNLLARRVSKILEIVELMTPFGSIQLN